MEDGEKVGEVPGRVTARSATCLHGKGLDGFLEVEEPAGDFSGPLDGLSGAVAGMDDTGVDGDTRGGAPAGHLPTTRSTTDGIRGGE